MSFNIDVIVFITFLFITLIIGIWNGRNINSIKQYALGEKKFSTGALVATIVATWIGGDYLFITLSEVYTSGLHYAIGCLGMVTCLLLNAFIFAPRMANYIGSLSVAESMGRLYGKHVRLITAIASTIAASGFIALQFKVFGFILSNFVGLTGNYPIFLAAIIVVIYSAFGGIKSVAFTDVFQFFTFGVLLPVLGAVIWYSCINNPDFSISNTTTHQLFNFGEYFDISGNKFWSMFTLFLLFSIPDINPAIFQRFAIGENVDQVKKAFAYASLLLALILISMSWIAFLLFNIDQNLNPNELVTYIVDNYSNDSLRVFIMIGVVAMCMSSADSNINSVSVILTHDFCNVLNLKIRSELFLSKIIAILLGISSVLLAMTDYDLLPLVFMTQSFYIPIVDVPLILAVIGFKSSTRAVLIGMTASLISVFIWRSYFMDTGIDSILPATIVNLVFFMTSHYLLGETGGWKKKNKNTSNFLKIKLFLSKIISYYKNFNFIFLTEKYVPKNTEFIITCGIFCGISTICSMYSISHSFLSKEDKNSLVSIYETMLAISVFFAVYPIWPNIIKHNKILLSIIWNASLCYLMIFSNSFLMLLSGITESQIIILVLNILTLSVLVNWKNALVIIMLGIFSSFCLSNITFDELNLNSTWITFYSVILSITIIVIFLKPKQIEEKEKEMKINFLKKEVDYTQRELANITQGMDFLEKQLKQKEGSLKKKEVYLKEQVKIKNAEISKLTDMKDEFLRNITHESNTPMTGIISMCDVLYSCYDQLDNNQIKRTIKDIVNSGDRLKSYVNSIVDLSKLTSNKYDLTKEDVNLGKLVKERTILYKKVFSDEVKKQKFDFNIKGNFIVNCDRYYITQAIDNLISNAVTYGRGKPITISLEREEDGSTSFSIKDQGVGIQKLELMSIFEKFSVGSKTKTLAGGRGVGLALCKSVIEAHGGNISATSDEKGSIFTFTLPKKA